MCSSTRPATASPPSAPEQPRRPSSVGRRRIERVRLVEGQVQRRYSRDALSTEEPLEIVLDGGESHVPLAVTMRTPGADFDLVAGFLHAEGLIDDRSELVSMRFCAGSGAEPESAAGLPEDPARATQLYNRVAVRLSSRSDRSAVRTRGRYTTSSCGVCGMDSIDQVRSLGCPAVGEGPSVSPDLLISLTPKLRDAQTQFDRTGGLHAAALFDARGNLLCIREDVGRHNAMDKLIGASLLAGELPLRDRVLLLSGRLSFELMQKAARAGVAIVAAVSAPSTLAVALAEQTGATLVGFLRENGFNVYAGGGRIGAAPPVPVGIVGRRS